MVQVRGRLAVRPTNCTTWAHALSALPGRLMMALALVVGIPFPSPPCITVSRCISLRVIPISLVYGLGLSNYFTVVLLIVEMKEVLKF